MPLLISGAAAVVSAMNRAFSDTSPSNAVYANQIAEAGTTVASQAAWAVSFGSKFTGTSAALADLLLTNTGIKAAGGTALATAVAAIIDIVGVKNVGQVAMLLSNALSTLEADATYGAAAKAWNAEVTAAYEYSANTANTQSSSASTTTGNEASSSYVLTTGQDIRNGTSGNDFFRGVAGQPIGAQEQTTFNSSDILDGLAGTDTLIINLVGNYNGGARVKNIETLQLGVNVAGAAAFDYNVNQGANEITDVTTVVADQINVGETLTVNNIVRTDLAGAKVQPTLSWVNDSNTAVAGTVNYNYRAAELTGTTDTQVVSLDSVNNGVLNLAAGIETVTLRSVAAERVTLLNSTNADTGTNAVAADVISSGSLTRVNIEAAAEVGKVGGRVATTGLMDRVATDGVGSASAGTAANLLSVGARVTTVDANTSTANVNVQFVAKTDGAATNVTFTGGAGNDYAEFEIGNVNATGNAGNDTFAFVTQRNGVTNSTFGAGDSIVGGAGTDVIQIGDNGVGTYTISDSEWANKSGVETVDLRGAVNTITLSSAFVSAPDAGVKLTVTTDNMVVGGTAPSNAEDLSLNTVDLRMLDGGQGINFVGGQGSDRLILSDSTYTSAMTLNGGAHTTAAGVAVAGDYDTLTVSNSAVLDRTDLSGTSGFEGLVLTKDVTGSVTTVIEMTEAFVLANTVAVNSATTSIDDRIFQIGTSAGASGTALVAGDTVRIDVTDLFTVNNNTVKASVVGRQLDVSSLTAAGVTVQYVYNGTTYANLAALATAVPTVGGNAVLTGADAAGADVVGGVALPGPVALFFTGTAADESVTLIAAGNSVNMAGGTDTINIGALAATGTLDGGAGTDTIVFGAGGSIVGATVQNVEAFTMAGAGSMTATQYNAFANGANAGSGADVLTISTAGTITGDADIETITFGLAGSTNQITLAGATAQTINGNTGADTIVSAIANTANKTIAAGTGTDVLTVTDAVAANWTLAAAGAAGAAVTGVETVNLSAGVNTGATLTMFNGAATVNLTTGLVATQNGGAIALGTGGQTVNVTGGSTGVYTVTANTGADALNLTAPGGAVTYVAAPANSLVTAFDTITGFRAGTDRIDTTTAVGANAFTAQVVATADTAGLAAALTNAVAAAVTAAATNYDANGDTVVVTISAGSAAGVYVVHNEGLGNGGFVTTEDLVVKLVGTVGVLTAADII